MIRYILQGIAINGMESITLEMGCLNIGIYIHKVVLDKKFNEDEDLIVYKDYEGKIGSINNEDITDYSFNDGNLTIVINNKYLRASALKGGTIMNKNKPTKVINVERRDNGLSWKECPNCRKTIGGSYKQTTCPHCGQKILWY